MKKILKKIYFQINQDEYDVLINALLIFVHVSKKFFYTTESKKARALIAKLQVNDLQIGVKKIGEKYIFNLVLTTEELAIMLKSIYMFGCVNVFFSYR